MAINWERRYEQAKSAKRRSERRESSYVSARNRAQDDLKAAKNEKINLEKRLKGIDKIIKLLTEPGGLFSKNVPDKVQKAEKGAEETGEHYEKCIVCTSVNAVDLREKFRTASVEANADSARALEAIRRERTRVAEAIEEINRQINMLQNKIEDYKAMIRKCNSEQADYSATMRRCLANM